MVLCMSKSLSGVKQSLHIWNGPCKDSVMSLPFVASRVDGGLVVHHDKEDQGKLFATLIWYVDDLLIIATEGFIVQITDQLKNQFWMHDLCSVPFSLGMNIERNWEHHTIDINQDCYFRTIFAKFRMDVSWPVATPMAMKLYKRSPDEESCEPTIYQLIIRSLMYAMTATRPDIAYASGVISRYNHHPSNDNIVALKRVFQYLIGTKNWRLHLGWAPIGALGGALGGERDGAPGCYVDSDFPRCEDDNKSTSGVVFTFGGVVVWRSRKLKSTAQSTTNAEYNPFVVGCMKLTQISHLLNELGIPTGPHMFSDSQSPIASMKNRIYRRSAVAQITTKDYLAADMAYDGEIDLTYIPTAEMLVDYFWKPLPKPALIKQCAAMGMIGMELGNGLRIGSGNWIGNGFGNGFRYGIGSGKGIGNAIGK